MQVSVRSECQGTANDLHISRDCVFWSRMGNLLLELFPDYIPLALITLTLGKCLKGRKLPRII